MSPVPLTSAAMLPVEVCALAGTAQPDHRCSAVASRLRAAVQVILSQRLWRIVQCLLVIRSPTSRGPEAIYNKLLLLLSCRLTSPSPGVTNAW